MRGDKLITRSSTSELAHAASPEHAPATTLPRGRTWLVPSLSDVIFLVNFSAVVAYGSRTVSADGDPARQLRLGEYILSTGTLPRVDLFSHTMAGQSFVPYEWLAEVVSAASARVFGLAGPVLVHGVIIALTFVVLYAALRTRGHGLFLSVGVVILATATSSIAWIARPHVYTMLGLALCWAMLDAWYRGKLAPRLLWLLPPMFLIWANFHGGFLVGWITLGAFVGADIARWAARAPGTSDAARARLGQVALPALASLLAVVINPEGFGMFDHIFGHLGHRFTLDRTDEFASPDFHSDRAQTFLVMLLIACAAALWSRRAPALHEGGLVLVFTFFALYAIRNVPLYALIVAPVLAAQLEALPAVPGAVGERLRGIGAWLGRRERAMARGEATSRSGVWPALAVLGVATFALLQQRAGLPPLGVAFDGTRLPVAATDYLAANLPAGNGFNDQGWGGYLVYRLWPRQKVFIDGQTDFYGDELVAEYVEVAILGARWAEILDKHQIQWILFRTDTPLVQHLKRSPSWRVVHEDPLATVLIRAPAIGS